jgi:uncharacterized protein DUF2510
MSMSTTATSEQAGWYAVGGGRERYWDGSAWTEGVRPVPEYVQGTRRQELLAHLTAFTDHEQ